VFEPLLNHVEESYDNFSSIDRDEFFWDKTKQYVNDLPLDILDLNTLLDYTIYQLARIYLKCKNDYKSCVERLHTFKNAVKVLRDELKTCNEIPDIALIDFYKVDDRLQDCRFPKFSWFNLYSLFIDVKNYFKSLNKPITLNFIFEGDKETSVFCDYIKLMDCIKNLVFNAEDAIYKKQQCDFTTDEIVVKVFADESNFGIQCNDTGVGISEDISHKIQSGISSGIGWRTIDNAVKTMRGCYSFLPVEVGASIRVTFPYQYK
jgi:signal transduction histidine kinase